jgi:phosphoribosylformimino-5-aminoimidazole carboxamide ribotide isomerase
MKVIPAIDIRYGKVVRLIQGDVECETIYSESPLKMAQMWASFGVELIHIVDLDGAIEGRPRNLEIVKKIAKGIKAKVELGGGIRGEATIKEVLDSGIEKVVIGTRALDESFLAAAAGKFKERIVASIDADRGIVHTKGWVFRTRTRALDLAASIKKTGIRTINYTDISKDGTLAGPNLNSLRQLIRSRPMKGMEIIAAGGISTINDVRNLKALEPSGLKGIIIGKALYENTIDLREAMRVCGRGS